MTKIQILYFYKGFSQIKRYTVNRSGKTTFINKWEYDKLYFASSYNPNIKVLLPFHVYSESDVINITR